MLTKRIKSESMRKYLEGEMTEWPIVPDSKSGVPVTVPGVQIPLSPFKI